MTHPFLRLVDTGSVESDDVNSPSKKKRNTATRRQVAKDTQLTFPFDTAEPAQLQVLIVAMDNIHGRRFNESLAKFRPKIVLDLRHAVRFDIPGTNRKVIFEYLSALHSYYAVDSLPWHKLGQRDFMGDKFNLSPRLTHELLERKESPVMLLVPEVNHANMMQSYLNRLLSDKANVSWEMEQIE